MKKYLIILTFLLLPTVSAWGNETYLWFYNEVNPEECQNYNDTLLDNLDKLCTTGNLIDSANFTELTEQNCRMIPHLVYNFLCLQDPTTSCDDIFEETIDSWVARSSWTFADCGVIVSSEDFGGFVDYFDDELLLSDSFIDFIPLKWVEFEEIDEEPTARAPIYTNDLYEPNDAGSAGQIGYQNMFYFLFFSNIYQIPLFLIWNVGLFILLTSFFWWYWGSLSKSMNLQKNEGTSEVLFSRIIIILKAHVVITVLILIASLIMQ